MRHDRVYPHTEFLKEGDMGTHFPAKFSLEWLLNSKLKKKNGMVLLFLKIIFGAFLLQFFLAKQVGME